MNFLNMKIWVDDVRPAPYGYVWCKTVNEAKNIITCVTKMHDNECPDFLPCIHVLDLDHDAGEYAQYGGDYIKILDWLEKQGWSIPIKLHTMNPVGRENMRQIIQEKWLDGGNVMPYTKTYNKLVRDYIPDIIMSSGASCEVMSLDNQAYIQALDTKLMEEFGEFRENRDVEELADMLEVLFAMAKAHGYSWIDVASAHREKRLKRGGFDRAILLKTVTED